MNPTLPSRGVGANVAFGRYGFLYAPVLVGIMRIEQVPPSSESPDRGRTEGVN